MWSALFTGLTGLLLGHAANTLLGPGLWRTEERGDAAHAGAIARLLRLPRLRARLGCLAPRVLLRVHLRAQPALVAISAGLANFINCFTLLRMPPLPPPSQKASLLHKIMLLQHVQKASHTH